MIEYSLIPFHVVADYVMNNVGEHHAEADERDGYDPLDMDWEYYFDASHAGQCFVVVPTDNLKPVGYSVFFISSNASHKNVIEAESAGFYVEREYRGEPVAALFEKSNELLKQIGVNRVNYAVKREGLGKLLERAGYQNEYKRWSIDL